MLMNLRNAMMAGKRLPYDAELEYLESTGTQWIDTGIVANVNTRVVADLYTTETGNHNWFGGDVINQSSMWTGFAFNSYSSTRIEYVFGNSGWQSATANGVVGSIFSVDFSASAVKINGTTVATPSFTTFGTQSNPISLFVRHGGSAYISGRVYSFKIYDNGVLLRDFIPVRKVTVGYLYDRVTRKLFGNAGTGDFTLGPDVVPVEYIESHGTEYINTGIVVNSLTSPRLIAGIYVGNVDSNTYPLGGDGNGGNERFSIGVLTNKRLELRIGNYYNLTIEEGWYTVELDGSDGNGYVDGVLKYTSSTYANLRNNTSRIYFGRNAATGALHPGKIRCLQIFDGNTIVRSFRPVRVGTGSTWEGAMMDVLTRRIYRNAGTGAFTYGNDLRYPIPAE